MTPARTTGRLVSASPSVSADECWVPAGREVTIAGYTIPGGMLYVGSGLLAVAGHGVEPALIDPSLPVRRSSPNRSGAGMLYWPSYSSISGECRAAYLEWLAAGRRDPSAYIGYVFLYFYGLERRALGDSRQSEQSKDDVPAIMGEVKRLLQVYSGNNSFLGYARKFLDVLTLFSDGECIVDSSMERTGYELPIALRVGIARIVAAGKPLSPDLALNWFLMHPETSLRTPMRRCAQEFRELFRARYRREFHDGLVLKPNRSKLKVTISTASASFGGQVDLNFELPDIAALTAPVAKLRQIGESCAADLDAFSRWVGRNADSSKTVAAVALLPGELATTHDSQEAQALWNWIEKTLGAQDRAVCSADDLLRHCASFGEGKLAKSEAVLLAQLLEKGSFGIEPDVRFGGATLAPGGVVVLFQLPPEAPAIASPEYAAATVLLHLAVAVSAADGSISDAEKQHLEDHMQRALRLSDAERCRFTAHLTLLMNSPPNLTGLKKRLEPLTPHERSAMADFIIGVAGADGQISPDEIRTLGKIYPMLGLAAADVYGHVHAMTTEPADVAEGNEPVTVIAPQPSSGYAIPSPPRPANSIQLDMAAVKAKLAQSAQVSAILEDIFVQDEHASALPPVVTPTSSSKIPDAHRILLSQLVTRPTWSRAEFETMSAGYGLMPDGAIDALNEAAFEHTGSPVLEGDDPLQVDAATAEGLMT